MTRDLYPFARDLERVGTLVGANVAGNLVWLPTKSIRAKPDPEFRIELGPNRRRRKVADD
jgi:hypothetical protein